MFLCVGPCFFYCAVLSVLSSHTFAITLIVLMGKRAACFTVIVFLLSYDCDCSVSLHHGAMGWSAVCDCVNLVILAYFLQSS